MPALLRLKVKRERSDHGENAVVLLYGELDLIGAPRLRSALGTLLEVAAPRILVDMADLTFIDGAGLGTLAEAAHEARAADGFLVLRSPTPMVRRLLPLINLDLDLPIEDAS